jgi:hypothetical protein
MAIIDALPSIDIIRGYKGVIDFYVHRGIICARKWPKTHWESYTPAAQATAATFGQTARAVTRAAPEVIQAARDMAGGTPQTWKDVYMSILLGGVWIE